MVVPTVVVVVLVRPSKALIPMAALVLAALVAGVTTAIRTDLRVESGRRELMVARSHLEAAGLTEPLRPGVLEGCDVGRPIPLLVRSPARR